MEAGRIVTAATTEGGTMEFNVGDVVRGRFAARPERTATAIVRGKVDGQWQGDCLTYEQGFGYGTWGYDSQVTEVLRQAGEADEQAALDVQRRVRADTDRMLGQTEFEREDAEVRALSEEDDHAVT